jgi:hypothetical protein
MSPIIVHTQPAPRKPSKAFYCWLDDTHGILTRVDGIMYFLADDGALTEIEPQHCPFLMPCGEVGLADTQRLMDTMRGGLAAIACARAN